VLQNERSLDANRELAADLLRRMQDAPLDVREPVRSYVLCGRRKVRDPRTGLAVTGRAVAAYLDGGADTFLRRNAVALRGLAAGPDSE